MNKQETYEYLKAKGIDFEITEHKAVYNMEELAEIDLPYPGMDAKNLFVRNDKKTQFYLITVKGDKRVDLKEFRKAYGTRPLSFASENYLADIMKLTPGAVTPLGLLNDDEVKVEFFLDEFFVKKGIIGCHPNDNTATVWLKPDDLIAIIEEHGNKVNVIEI